MTYAGAAPQSEVMTVNFKLPGCGGEFEIGASEAPPLDFDDDVEEGEASLRSEDLPEV